MRLGNLERLKQAEKVLRVLSFGGGVQSSFLLLAALHGELPRPDAVIFSDPQWESRATYGWIERCASLASRQGIPFFQVTAGNIRESALNARLSLGAQAQRFAALPLHVRNAEGKPAMLRRQCTREFKIAPLVQKQRELLGVSKGQRVPKSKHALIQIGISLDEISRLSEPKGLKWTTNEYPLIELRMTRANCINWLESHGYPRPPKSACLGCPFKDNARWREMKINEPEEFADAVEFDELIREGLRGGKHQSYLHRSLVPLSEVDFRNAEDMGQLNMDGLINECEGMCGL